VTFRGWCVLALVFKPPSFLKPRAGLGTDGTDAIIYHMAYDNGMLVMRKLLASVFQITFQLESQQGRNTITEINQFAPATICRTYA
jgi:hypothetical protein